MLLGQWLLRHPDEQDFRVFARFPRRSGLILDIGANGGQSAVAFSFLLPRYRIRSFEPNPALWPELNFIGRLLGRKFSFDKVGLGDREGEMMLMVPFLGTLPITTRASMSSEEAADHCRRLANEFGEEPELRDVTVRIITLDSLELDPDFVKIDVEGFERTVLAGMVQTIARHRPVLMLERNADTVSCQEMLRRHGYVFAHYDEPSGHLVASGGTTRNWFALPEELARHHVVEHA